MAVSWMEHEAWQRGVHIHHSMCGHGGERMIAGYPVDGFCLEAKTVFQFHSCHWHGCPECLVWFQDLEEIGDVCKMETRKRQVDITGPSRWGLRSTRWPSSGCAVLLLTVWTSSSTGVITSWSRWTPTACIRAVVWFCGKGGVPRHGGKVASQQKGMVCMGQMECSRAGTFQAGIRGHSQNRTVQQVLFHGRLERRGESVLDGELKAPKQNALGAVQSRAGGGHRFHYEQRNENEWRGDVHLAAKKRIFSHHCRCILKPFFLFLFLSSFVKQQTKFDFLNLFWKVVDNRLHQISPRINKVVLCSHYTDNKLCQCLIGARPYCWVMASAVYARAAILLRWGSGQKKCDYFLLGLCGVGGVWWSHSLVKMCFRSTTQVVGSES